LSTAERVAGERSRRTDLEDGTSDLERPIGQVGCRPRRSDAKVDGGYGDEVTTVRHSAPIFPVSDVSAAMRHYRSLGFATREYAGGGYAYATRDVVEIHLAGVRDLDPTRTASAAYLWVDDADALAREWEAAGLVVTAPIDTDWGQHEGAHTDPYGNLIRFGSPVRPSD
jgi:predicted enzyme related to lactoylglutathione lyase